MQYEKRPNQALNCNIFRIPFHPLSNRSHKAHHGHNGFEIRSFCARRVRRGRPRPEFTNLTPHLIMRRADWRDDSARMRQTEGWLSPV